MAELAIYALVGVVAYAAVSASSKQAPVVGPKLDDNRVMGSEYGKSIPHIFGHPFQAPHVIYASKKRSIPKTTTEGGKGPPGVDVTTFTHEVDLYLQFADCESAGVSRIKVNGKLVYNMLDSADIASVGASLSAVPWARMTFYGGDAAQLPDPDYEAAVGAGNAPAYRGRTTIFFKSFQLDAGGNMPNITAEIFKTGTAASTGYYDLLNDPIDSVYTPLVGTTQYFTNGSSDHGPIILMDASLDAGTINDTIERTVPTSLASGVRVKFEVREGNVDDAGVISFRTAAGALGLSFNPRREVTFDPLQRPELILGAAVFTLGTEAVPINTFCMLEVIVNPGANTSTATIKRLPDEVVLSTQTLTGTFTPFVVERQRFTIDHSGVGFAMCPTAYADIYVFPTRASIVEETLESTVSTLLLRAGMTADMFDVTALAAITTPVRAFSVGLGPTRAAIEQLMLGYGFDWVLRDKLRAFVRGLAPVVTIPYADMGASNDAAGDPEPFLLKQGNDIEIPPRVAVRYLNIDTECNIDVQQSDRLVSATSTTDLIDLPLGFTAAEAKQIAERLEMDRFVGQSLTSTIKLLGTYAALEAGDVVTAVAEDASTFRMRAMQIEDAQGVRALSLVGDDASVLTSAGVTSSDYVPSVSVSAPVGTVSVLLDVPALIDSYGTPGFMVAAAPAGTGIWGGAVIRRSTDGVSFTDAATVAQRSVIGAATELGAWPFGHVFDEINAITVTVNGELTSATRAQLFADRTLNSAAIGRHGRWEIIRFRDAALLSTGVYLLSGLMRGRLGTEWAMGTHEDGDQFVLLGAGLVRVPHGTSDIGLENFYKAVTVGRPESTAATFAFTEMGVSVKPFAPIDARASRSGDNITVTWRRRTRMQTRYLGPLGASVPVGETAEAYVIDVLDTGVVVDTLTSSTPSVTFDVTDYGFTPGDPVEVAIHQVSAAVGRGYALEATV